MYMHTCIRLIIMARRVENHLHLHVPYGYFEQYTLSCSWNCVADIFILKIFVIFPPSLISEIIVEFVYIHIDPTLTLNNVTAIMKDVQRQWEDVADWIGTPLSKCDELKSQSPTTDQAKQACWDYWLHHHPAPSWRILAGGLYRWGEHGALEVLQMNYLKGEYVCASKCMSWLPYIYMYMCLAGWLNMYFRKNV